MVTKNTVAKTLLRKQKRVDSWFVSRYSFNLYRGCIHDCIYCDGRSEKYQVAGNFGKEITIKTNAVELLKQELAPNRKRRPLKKGFVLIGGGVGDFFQFPKNHHSICQELLEILRERRLPIHILTKATNTLDYVDSINAINNETKAIVSFSFSSVRQEICKIFEPGVPSPPERLRAIETLTNKGIACGVYLMPVLPYISDSREAIFETVEAVTKAGAQFIVFGGMTLKKGRQMDLFLQTMNHYQPSLIARYKSLYQHSQYGNAPREYYQQIGQNFNEAAALYKIPKRLPARLFTGVIDKNDQVAVILEQLDYLLKQKGQQSSYGYTAHIISQLKDSLWTLRHMLTTIKGVTPELEKLILEILTTGTCQLYEENLY